MSSSSPTAAPVKRACDSCHRRKVKCIGEGTNPCKNCVSAGLACTYNAIPQKKGPKGSRAKVLSELRESQRNASLVAGFPPDLGFDSRLLSSTLARTPGLLPEPLVQSCLDFFFTNVYSTEPVLHRQKAQEAAHNMDRCTESYCMITALCAYVMIQANMNVPANLLPRPDMAQMSNMSLGHVLLEESVRVRKGYDYREEPTHLTVLTSWFYYGCYFSLGSRENTAWSYLREATTQAQLLGMHDEETYKHDPLDISRKRVLYWLLFIEERMYALHKHRPITLYPTIHPPSLDEVPADRPITAGLELMIALFKTVDDTFVNLWNRVHTQANPAWISQLQTQLAEAVPGYLECTEAQAVAIRVTQHWLRAMTWQLCVCQGLTSSVSSDPSMTFKFPIDIARDLLTMTHQFSQQSMEVHGAKLVSDISLVIRLETPFGCVYLEMMQAPSLDPPIPVTHGPCQDPSWLQRLSLTRANWEALHRHGHIVKLFDVACCLTDVVAVTSLSPDAFALGPRDYVPRFLTLISNLRGGQTRYLPALLAKLSDVLPSLPLPRSLTLPQPLPASTISMSGPGHGTVPSNVGNDYSAMPVVAAPPYPSTDLIRRLAAQTGAQLPFNTSQQPGLQAPTSHVEELSLYDSAHSNTHSSGSATRSTSTTPGPYEAPMAQQSSYPSHGAVQLPTSHPQHTQLQSHHIGVPPTSYDPRFGVQGYPLDPSMMFKQ